MGQIYCFLSVSIFFSSQDTVLTVASAALAKAGGVFAYFADIHHGTIVSWKY
jgi:hypothetical protein